MASFITVFVFSGFVSPIVHPALIARIELMLQ
jgi:hypothetical protein